MAENRRTSSETPGVVLEGSRPLGDEMLAEGWHSLGREDGELLMWLHPPSYRAISISGPVPRKSKNYDCTPVRAIPDEPNDPSTLGYLVECSKRDECGNPTEGSCFWIESFGAAVKHARSIRTSILAEHPPIQAREQTELFTEERKNG